MQEPALIVGLGNIGTEYENTRHNAGFMLADALLAALSRENSFALQQQSSGKKPYELWKYTAKDGTPWFIMKPFTLMNRSGDAVAPVANFYRIPSSRILVLHDELDLPVGRIKYKIGGGHAGHNGLRSIAACIGNQDFHRIRIGIDKPQGGNTVSHVLGRFNKAEQPILQQVLDCAVEGIQLYMTQGATPATNLLNAANFCVEKETK